MRRILALLLVLAGLPLGAQTTSVALNESSGNYASVGSGINLGTETFYDSFLRNNLIINPDFQGPLYNSTATVSSGAVGSFVDRNSGSAFAANQFAGGTYYVGCHGGSFSGSNQICTGGAYGCSGTITSNTAPSGGSGSAFVVTGCGSAFAANDTVFIYAPVVAMSNSNINFNYFAGTAATSGTASVTVDSTSGDQVTPAAVQCMKLTLSAGSSSASLSTNFDTSGMLNYDFQTGHTFTDSLMVNILSGSGMTITGTVVRSGGINGSVTLSPSGSGWHTYSGTFTGNESGATSANTVVIKYALTGASGSSVCITHASVIDSSDTNPSTLRDQVFNDLVTTGHMGEMRLSYPVNGDSLANLTAAAGAHAPSWPQGFGDNNQPTLQWFETLNAALKWGVPRVWLSVPVYFQSADMQNAVDYLCGGSGTTYGAIRIAQGQTTPWCDVENIVLEWGNETWNSGFGNISFPQYTTGGNSSWNAIPMAILAGTAAKADANWNSSTMKFALGVQTAPGVGADQATRLRNADTGHAVDILAKNFYGMYDLTNCSTQQLFQSGSTEYWANVFDASSASGVNQIYAAGKPTGDYEGQNSTNSGSCTQIQLTGLPEGEGYGVIAPLAPMLMNQQFAQLDNDYFVLYQFSTGISTSGGATSIAEWGAKNGPGGAFNNARPALYGMGVANLCANLGTGYGATPTSPPTLNYTGGNGVNNESNVPLLQFFPFKGSSNRCIVVYNTDYSNSHTFAFTGASVPTGTVTVTTLSSTNTTDTNEAANTAPVVAPAVSTVSNPSSFTLAAHAVEAISWSVGGFTPAPLTIIGNTGIQGNVTIIP